MTPPRSQALIALDSERSSVGCTCYNCGTLPEKSANFSPKGPVCPVYFHMTSPVYERNDVIQEQGDDDTLIFDEEMDFVQG